MATQFSKLTNTPSRNDALLDRTRAAEGWVKTRVIAQGDEYFRAIKLIPCSVHDKQRMCHLDGQWWKLEESDFTSN